MKKILLTLGLAAGIAAGAQAQLQIGPKVGLNLSTMVIGSDNYEGASFNTSFTLGFNAGLAANVEINQTFSFAPELIYSKKGGKVVLSGTTYSQEGDLNDQNSVFIENIYKMNFVELPLLLRAHFGSSGMKAYVHAGPSVGYWLGGSYETVEERSRVMTENGSVIYMETFSRMESGKFKFVDAYSHSFNEDSEVLKNKANRLTLGASLGGGIILPVAGRSLLIDARYQHAFGDLVDQDPADGYYHKFRTSGFSLSAIYLFDL